MKTLPPYIKIMQVTRFRLALQRQERLKKIRVIKEVSDTLTELTNRLTLVLENWHTIHYNHG